MFQERIETKLEAYADDVNITLQRSESSLRESIRVLEGFEKISGLKINRDKTQVLKIGKSPQSDSNLCPDLGLKYLQKLKALGITFTADPKQMEDNFDEKYKKIEKLFNRWSFRNLTVYGRISIVKSLALSKLTHIVQVVPNPPKKKIDDLQKLINNFVWNGTHGHIVCSELAARPLNEGGLARVSQFWDSLKLVWVNRLAQAADDSKWRRIFHQQMSRALNRNNLTSSQIFRRQGQQRLPLLQPPVLQPILERNMCKFDPAAEIFYKTYKNSVAETALWGRSTILSGGQPLDRRNFLPICSEKFKLINDLLNPATGAPWLHSTLTSGKWARGGLVSGLR